MPRFCCFWCPAPSKEEREITSACPTCGRSYDVPRHTPPARVGEYDIEEYVSRGFYGAVYRARQASLRRVVALKIVPVAVYEKFSKDWDRECQEHAAIADNVPFVADITNQFRALVDFGGSELDCHVAVLANKVGPTLEAVLIDPVKHGLTPRAAAQITADLFAILHLFEEKQRHHNDLHAGNIIVERLSSHALRTGQIDPTVRAVAIDLGSVLDRTQSADGRLGDQQQIALQIARLASAVRLIGDRNDLDFRIAGALRGLAEHLTPAADAQRRMTVDDALRTLRSAMNSADEPWRQRLSLQRFGDAYNAQSLESWHVPELWFDPDDKWLRRTTVKGPQVITGMRGCGKTMLLRALHFHARAECARIDAERAGESDVSQRLAQDDFLGVYASCQKLLNPIDRDSKAELGLLFARLYVAYLRDAIQALRHLRSFDAACVPGTIDVLLMDALQPLDLGLPEEATRTEHGFEHALLQLQLELADGGVSSRLKTSPAEAFGHLADVIRRASPALSQKYVLFLLDDVSTRYIDEDTVRAVISRLLFPKSHCAFRITTEAQTLQRVLRSPGNNAPADPNRDYEEFDLGNEVYRLLQERSTKQRKDFISEILRRRGRQFNDDLYRRDPVDVLGDVPLARIAEEIATSSSASGAKKKVYRGLRALQAVCVGDLGDVVKLYEKILLSASPTTLPVPAEKQTTCFLEHSANLVHALNRRDPSKKTLALAFAQAARDLLVRSSRKGDDEMRKDLRQYTKLYVRVDPGPGAEAVVARLLDLLDAGVFVYDGGNPRTKTRDDDPVLQFKLSYRKMLGLASFIGLSDRDRFELSGDALRRWLEAVDDPKATLLANQTRDEPAEEDPGAPTEAASEAATPQTVGQLGLPMPNHTPAPAPVEQLSFAPDIGLEVHRVSLSELADLGTLVVACGFEERALESVRRVLAATRFERAVLVRYDAEQGRAVGAAVSECVTNVVSVDDFSEIAGLLAASPSEILVDTSGMSKPFLYVAIKAALNTHGRVTVVHTLAERHYPSNEDLAALGVSVEGPMPPEIMAQLADKVLVGEAGPYQLVCVDQAAAAPERWRALIASASPKNDRLLHLLDQRSFDATRVLVPKPSTARRRLAWTAAELAASAVDSNFARLAVDTNDLPGAVQAVGEAHNDLYFTAGANIEVGLTGSKIHAVACAALAAATRVACAWYVAPKSFDQERFTEGVAETECFTVRLTAP